MNANPTMMEMLNLAYLTMFAQNGTSPPATLHSAWVPNSAEEAPPSRTEPEEVPSASDAAAAGAAAAKKAKAKAA